MKRALQKLSENIKKIEDEAEQLVLGRRVRIISDYNGQPYGHSRPSLKGHIFTVAGIIVTGNEIHLWDGDYEHCYININEVLFV